MAFDQLNEAVEDARTTIARSDAVVRQIAGLLRGRLRVAHIDRHTLAALKRELQDFNSKTGRWK